MSRITSASLFAWVMLEYTYLKIEDRGIVGEDNQIKLMGIINIYIFSCTLADGIYVSTLVWINFWGRSLICKCSDSVFWLFNVTLSLVKRLRTEGCVLGWDIRLWMGICRSFSYVICMYVHVDLEIDTIGFESLCILRGWQMLGTILLRTPTTISSVSI